MEDEEGNKIIKRSFITYEGVLVMHKLTLEETKEKIGSWRENYDKEALESIMMDNMGLVMIIARKYFSAGVSFDDLKMAGCEGMIML